MKDWKVTGYEMDGDNTRRGEKREKRIKTKWGDIVLFVDFRTAHSRSHDAACMLAALVLSLLQESQTICLLVILHVTLHMCLAYL